jgi:polar amino acid transport system substrate-binding protein
MSAHTPHRRAALLLAALASAVLAATGCGSAQPASAPPASADSGLAAKVPAALRAKGAITIGTDATYAPSEFLDVDGKTVIGFDVDLFNAVAAKLNLKTDWQPSKFTDIIPGVETGKYTIGVSSFTINAERMAETTMVSYFSAGTQWAALAGSAITPDTACGKKVAVQTGTVQVDDVTARSKKCVDAGQPAIVIDQFQAMSDATAAVVSGKDDALLADSPVGAYAAQQLKGKLVPIGSIYDSAPYGYVLPKDQAEFGTVLVEALRQLMADGTYTKILAKWGVESGAITTPVVNPAV